MFDLGPAASEMSRLVQGVRDDQLDARTPCHDWRLEQLLQHVNGFTFAFTMNARKQRLPDGDPTAGELPADWRSALPARLDELVAAWQDEAAWQGATSAGGIEMSAADNALVAVEELVLHGWDVARASGQDFRVDDASLDQVERFLEVFARPIESGQGPYGPPVPVPADRARWERVLGATGRDPHWSVERVS